MVAIVAPTRIPQDAEGFVDPSCNDKNVAYCQKLYREYYYAMQYGSDIDYQYAFAKTFHKSLTIIAEHGKVSYDQWLNAAVTGRNGLRLQGPDFTESHMEQDDTLVMAYNVDLINDGCTIRCGATTYWREGQIVKIVNNKSTQYWVTRIVGAQNKRPEIADVIENLSDYFEVRNDGTAMQYEECFEHFFHEDFSAKTEDGKEVNRFQMFRALKRHRSECPEDKFSNLLILQAYPSANERDVYLEYETVLTRADGAQSRLRNEAYVRDGKLIWVPCLPHQIKFE
eukprot:Clim_evm5s205 gene=Clim_evmTU5s205